MARLRYTISFVLSAGLGVGWGLLAVLLIVGSLLMGPPDLSHPSFPLTLALTALLGTTAVACWLWITRRRTDFIGLAGMAALVTLLLVGPLVFFIGLFSLCGAGSCS